MKIEPKELKDFIRASCNAIQAGVGDDFKIEGSIRFSLAVINKLEKGGALKIYVATARGKYNKEEISKLEFKVRPRA